MKFESTGTPGASASKRNNTTGQAGFTLIETLVALALVLAFVLASGPLYYHARQILLQGDGQVRAQLLLGDLLSEPFSRAHPQLGSRDGETGGMQWRVAVEPAYAEDPDAPEPPSGSSGKEPRIKWSLLRVTAHVYWGTGKVASAQTLRLGKLD